MLAKVVRPFGSGLEVIGFDFDVLIRVEQVQVYIELIQCHNPF